MYKHILQAIGGIFILLGSVVIIAWYTHNIELMQVFPSFISVQYSTALCFFLFGLILICYKVSLAKIKVSIFLPLMAAGLLATVSICLWQVLVAQEQAQIKQNIKLAASSVKKQIQFPLQNRVHALIRMASRWQQRKITPKKEWEMDAKNHIKYQPGYQAIEWVDSTFHVRWIEPLKGNEAALNLNLAFEKRRRKALERAKNKRATIMSNVINLVQGNKGFLVYTPIFKHGIFAGFILGVFQVQTLLDEFLKDWGPEYQVHIVNNNELIYKRTRIKPPTAKWHYKTKLEFYGVTWDIQVYPQTSLLAKSQTIFPVAVLIIGLVMALLFALTIRFAQKVVLHRREIKKTMEELQQYSKELERSNLELDDFAYIASHDLKEPVRAIHNNCQFLLEDHQKNLNEDAIKRVNRLIYLTERMAKLISDLLYFSRLGRKDLAIKETNLNQIVEDAKSMILDFEDVTIEIVDKLPTVVCNASYITEVFRNLITNGIKYNRNQKKHIKIGTIDSINKKMQKKNLVLYVKDNGIGIKERFYTDIFRIFKRLNSQKEFGEGTGAGLTFVKKIIERHNGFIWVESVYGKETTFFFTLGE